MSDLIFPWTLLFGSLILSLVGIIVNLIGLKSMQSMLEVNHGVYQLVQMDFRLFILSSSVSAGVFMAFFLDIRPEVVCLASILSQFPSYFYSIFANLAISIIRYRAVRGSFTNQVQTNDNCIKSLSKVLGTISFGYILLLYLIFFVLDQPWSSIIEVCRFGLDARSTPKWTNALLVVPIGSTSILNLIVDVRLALFLKSHVADPEFIDQNVNVKGVPIRATVLSVLWIIPQSVIVYMMGVAQVSISMESGMFCVYYRSIHIFRPVLMCVTILSHNKQQEAEDRISKDARRMRIRELVVQQ